MPSRSRSRSMSTANQETLRKHHRGSHVSPGSWGTERAPGQEDRDLNLDEMPDQEGSGDEANLQIARSKTPTISYNDGESMTKASPSVQTGEDPSTEYQSEAVSEAESGINEPASEGQDEEAERNKEEGKGKKKGKKGKKWSVLNLSSQASSSGGYLAPPSTTDRDSDGFTTVSRHKRSGSQGSMTSVGSTSSQRW